MTATAGTFPMGTEAPADPAPPGSRQGRLTRLVAALESLGRKLGNQRKVALEACALAPRAEEVALRARLLAFGCGAASQEAATALAADIDALAVRAGELAARAERVAAAGEGAGGAITEHAAALAALAHDARALADGAALRRMLAPLASILERLPAQRQEQAAVGVGLARLAEQAQPLADRAGRIASHAGRAAEEEALRLSRDLGAFAAEAIRLATAIEREASGGGEPRLAEAMAEQLARMAACAPAMAAVPPAVPHSFPAAPALPAAPAFPAAPALPARRFGKAAVWRGVLQSDSEPL